MIGQRLVWAARWCAMGAAIAVGGMAWLALQASARLADLSEWLAERADER